MDGAQIYKGKRTTEYWDAGKITAGWTQNVPNKVTHKVNPSKKAFGNTRIQGWGCQRC